MTHLTDYWAMHPTQLFKKKEFTKAPKTKSIDEKHVLFVFGFKYKCYI